MLRSVFLLLAATLTILNSCSEEEESYSICVEGQVTSSGSYTPISGAKVDLYMNNKWGEDNYYATTETSRSGFFKVTASENDIELIRYNLRITKEGYMDGSAFGTYSSDSNFVNNCAQSNVSLIPL